MAKWVFEPGHTAAEFRARHMMVTNVRGAFKNVQGTLDFDPENPRLSAVRAMIDATGIWTGEPHAMLISGALTSSTLRTIRRSPSRAIRWS